MSESESPNELLRTPETAIDLSEKERQSLFDASTRLLTSRGKVISPDPKIQYINEAGKEYIPNPYRKTVLSSDELEAYALPFDSITLTNEEDIANDPDSIVIEVGRMTTNLPVEEGQPPVTGVGYQRQWVELRREEGGIWIEDEDGAADLYPDMPDNEDLVRNPDGTYTHLKGSTLAIADSPPLSRKELVELTSALAKIQ